MHSTTAFSGGSRYRPTTSMTLASSCGSVENRKPPVRHGWIPCSRQIRATVALPIFNLPPSALDDQCVRPLDFDGGVSVAATTLAESTRRGRPLRAASRSPYSCLLYTSDAADDLL